MSESIPSHTVFVVDDDAAVRDALRLLLDSVGIASEQFASSDEFLENYDPRRAGCLVLDIRMPGMSGLDLQARLTDRGSLLPIIFITAHGDVSMAVEALKKGASDFLQKPFRDQELLDKIQDALELNARLRRRWADREAVRVRIDCLTPREREVMNLVVDGKANKIIAGELGISQRTVEIHRARVMKKMSVESVPQLVQMLLSVKEG